MPDALVRQYGRIADVRVGVPRSEHLTAINAVRRPAGPTVRPGERGLRCRQVRVDVRDPIHVFGVQPLGGRGQIPRQPLIDREVTPPQLWEFEVRIGESELKALCRPTGHRGRLIGVRIRVERIRRGRPGGDETGQHARVPDLVGDPYVRRTAGEYAGAAAQLRVVLAMNVV